MSLLRRLDDWLLSPAPPERLALLRIVVGLYALVNVFISTGEFARLAERSASQFEPVGVATVLDEPVSPATLWSLYVVSIVSGLAFVAGARLSSSGPIFALCNLAWASYHASWGQMLHFEHVVTLHLLVLGFSPAADALAADALATDASAKQPASFRYGWPIRLMAIITTVTYSLAGVAKLRASGWTWVEGTTLANHIAYSTTRLDLLGEWRPPLASLVVRRDWLLGPMAVGSLALELFAPLALFSRRFRRLWVPGIVAFHLGTLTTMFVFFSYNGLGFAILPLFRVERAFEWLKGRGWFRGAGVGSREFQLSDPG